MGRGLGIAVIAFALAGCAESKKSGGGTGNSREPTWECTFSMTLSGEITETIATDAQSSCSVTHSVGSGIVWDIDSSEGTPYLALYVEDVIDGELGAFPAFLEIYTQDLQHRYVAPGCTVTLTEHELVETEQYEGRELKTYRVVGSGTCPQGAVDANAGGRLTLSDFEFRLMSIWEIP